MFRVVFAPYFYILLLAKTKQSTNEQIKHKLHYIIGNKMFTMPSCVGRCDKIIGSSCNVVCVQKSVVAICHVRKWSWVMYIVHHNKIHIHMTVPLFCEKPFYFKWSHELYSWMVLALWLTLSLNSDVRIQLQQNTPVVLCNVLANYFVMTIDGLRSVPLALLKLVNF